MFETDPLSELNFVLEFNLPKEISCNQEHIKLLVHHVDVPIVEIPVCPLGCRPIPIKTPGEIHCIERYKHIKDILQLINRLVNSVYCERNKLSSRSNQFVEAKLYAYKNNNNNSLFKKWSLVEFYPLFNPDIDYITDNIELIFKFENLIDESK